MENENITQPEVGANPVNGATNTPQNEGNNNQPQVKQQEGKLFTQQDLDNIAAKARGSAERETRKKIFAELGLKDDEGDKLGAYKEAYQNSLSDEEKRNKVMEDLQADNIKLTQDLEEKDYVIKALVELTGKNENDVQDIVDMARGLKKDDNTIEDAIKKVISLINNKPVPATQIVENQNIPQGNPLTQPSTTVQVSTQDNPFKVGSINLTKQAELIKTNPELARKLKAEAGYNN